jgi:hypothetical protein
MTGRGLLVPLFVLLLADFSFSLGCGSSGGDSGGNNNGTGGNGPSGNDLGSSPVGPAPADLATPPDLAPPPAGGNPFAGTWLYGTGATSGNDCLGNMPPTDVSAQTFTVTVKDAKTISLSQASCNFDFTIAGDTATVIAGQMCTVTANGFKLKLTSKTGTFTTHDGISGSLDTLADVVTQFGTCHATLSAPMTKKM